MLPVNKARVDISDRSDRGDQLPFIFNVGYAGHEERRKRPKLQAAARGEEEGGGIEREKRVNLNVCVVAGGV